MHRQQLGHVLRGGEDECNERAGGVPAGSVLRRVWHHGDIFKSGHGDFGWGDECSCMTVCVCLKWIVNDEGDHD